MVFTLEKGSSAPGSECVSLRSEVFNAMGDDWDDDEWDADELLEQADKKKKGAWDDEEEEDDGEDEQKKKEEEERIAKAEAERKAREDEKSKKKAEVYVPLADPVQEKLRRQKLEEEADHALTSELFDGFEKKDSSSATAGQKSAEASKTAKKAEGAKIVVKDKFDDLELKTQKDLEDLCKVICVKVGEAKAKGAAGKLIIDLLKIVEKQIDLKDMEALDKKLTTVIKAKKVEKTEAEANKKKGNEKLNKNTKFNAAAEMDEMYGGAAEDWDDQWEDWEEGGDWK